MRYSPAMLLLSICMAVLFVYGVIQPAPADSHFHSYFDTSRPERIVATVVSEVSELEEVAGFSNAFYPFVASLPELAPYLQANANRMLPIVSIGALLLDAESGVLQTDHQQTLSAIVATVSTNHSGRVLFLLDEILWRIRLGCHRGKQLACDEVERRYANTLTQLRVTGRELRRRLPRSGLMHVEPHAELNRQMASWNRIVMLDDAEYLAFDCYGAIEDCGGRPQVEYLQWVMDAVHALERENPIGRKIFLVPGAFQSFYAFQDENAVIAQLQPYFSAFDSSDLFGGIGVFSWGNVADGPTVLLGARNLARVRPVLAALMRARLQADVPLTLSPAMSIVGAFTQDWQAWHASFTSVRVPVGSGAYLYVQSAGMDGCTLSLTGQEPMQIAVNRLAAFALTPQPGAVIDATASCSGNEQSFRRSIRLEFQ